MILTCPHCNTGFEVDKNHYADLLTQVKNKEFEKELNRRIADLDEKHKLEEDKLKLQIESQKKSETDALRTSLAEMAAEISRLQSKIEGFETEKRAALAETATDHQREIAKLKADKDNEIASLKSQLSVADMERQMQVKDAENASKEEINKLKLNISDLASQLDNQKVLAKNKELELKNSAEVLIRAKDEEIERLRDMKSRLSTKLLGESLEQHCLESFNAARSMGLFPHSTFDKDNTVTDGTKGDFIFRDFIDGKECLSIMFEMKTEDDNSVHKHKNEDFLAKLDKDRRNKNCEYAVLVSTLEADNERYNGGIVDVSYLYDKMYVVRPQFFMPVISLLSRAMQRSALTIRNLRSDLEAAQATSVDISTFEKRRDKFAEQFKKHVEDHFKKHTSAMNDIDKAITAAEKQVEFLRKVKLTFEDAQKKLERANKDIEEDFTIRKLTYGNPTMRKKFEEVRNSQTEDDSEE